jgi:hypothetical protein
MFTKEEFKLIDWALMRINESGDCPLDVRERIQSLRMHKTYKNNKSMLPHGTEKRMPEACQMFQDTTAKMYQLFLEKNMDYSPQNIKGTGMVGIMTRFWDKTSRLMHLMGFNTETGEYFAEREAKNETKEDNFIDAANYSIIALIYRAGKWGK